MPYTIFATCEIGRIMSRRMTAPRAIRQGRDYRRRGYTQVRIVDVETGEEFDIPALAARVQSADKRD